MYPEVWWWQNSMVYVWVILQIFTVKLMDLLSAARSRYAVGENCWFMSPFRWRSQYEAHVTRELVVGTVTFRWRLMLVSVFGLFPQDLEDRSFWPTWVVLTVCIESMKWWGKRQSGNFQLRGYGEQKINKKAQNYESEWESGWDILIICSSASWTALGIVVCRR